MKSAGACDRAFLASRKRWCAMNLDFFLKAASAAVSEPVEDVSDLILRAANAMPLETSDFDRGIAAGFALARHLSQDNLSEEAV
jgi:hypothetical protein